jgi:hypothetical protein
LALPRDLLAVNTAALILDTDGRMDRLGDTTAILHTAERYAQNAEIVACVSSAHKREVLFHKPVTYPVVIE